MNDPIVFVPGLLCTTALYAPQIAALPGGAKHSIADHTRHDSMAEIAEAILAEAPERFILVGLSMGGYIALEMVERAPDRIAALVLMDTNARPDLPEQTALRKELMAVAGKDGIGPVIERLLPNFVGKAHLEDAALVETVRKMAFDTGVEAFARQQTAIMNRKDARPDLAAIACPTLVICGDRDVLTPPELSEEIVSSVPGAHLTMIEGSGHLTTLEKPGAVNDALKSFLWP